MAESLQNKIERCPLHGTYAATYRFERWSDCPTCERVRFETERHEATDEAMAEYRRHRVNRLRAMVNLPPRFKEATLDNYRAETDGQHLALRICRRYLAAWSECLRLGRCLQFIGEPGTGKTMLAAAITNALAADGFHVEYWETYGALDCIRLNITGENANETFEIERFTCPDLLVLDEVGSHKLTEWERGILFKIINERYKALKPSILISNLPADQYRAWVGDRVFDRLRENNGATVMFNWQSYRGVPT